MKARWLGILTVGAWILLGAAAARAYDTGGPPLGEEKQLSGKVVKSEGDTVYLEHMGAVVPIELRRDTKFYGVRSANQLTEGQEVRASFALEGDSKNVADSISVGAPPSATRRAREPATAGYRDTEDYGG